MADKKQKTKDQRQRTEGLEPSAYFSEATTL